MKAEVVKPNEKDEYWFEEGCFILESANDPGDEFVSIARARVLPGTATRLHKLNGVAERYIIISGRGTVEIGGTLRSDVKPGDVVRIPSNTSQRICNTGDKDLLFYVVCSPRFTGECYVSLAARQ